MNEPLIPVTEPSLGPDDERIHVYCCDPDVALCGTPLSGADLGPHDGTGTVECFSCVAVDEAGVPCRVRFCRLRSWWRRRRSS